MKKKIVAALCLTALLATGIFSVFASAAEPATCKDNIADSTMLFDAPHVPVIPRI